MRISDGFITGGHSLWLLLLLLIFGPPVLLVAWLTGKHDLVYHGHSLGARNWLRLSGTKVQVSGSEHLEPDQTYVFISNHRSYLDTATLFVLHGSPARSAGKEGIAQCAYIGVGMGFVNVMASIALTASERGLRLKRRPIDPERHLFRVFAKARGRNRVSFFRLRWVRLYGSASRRSDRACGDQEHGLFDGKGNWRSQGRNNRDGNCFRRFQTVGYSTMKM